MNQPNCAFDVSGHQQRWEQEGVAIKQFLDATEHIKSMDEELHRHNEQLQSQTDQLKAHNDNFRALNRQLKRESADREKGDKQNRRVTIIAVLLTCFLTFFLDHIFDLYHLLFRG